MSGENEINFQFLAENSADIICRAGLDRVLLYVSPSAFAILGWKPEEMTGRSMDDFISAEDVPVLAAALASYDEDTTIRMLKKDGATAWMENHARLVRGSDTGEPREFVIVMRDITRRKLLEEQLSALALTDGLTGLSNRRAFDEALEREWRHTLQEGSQISLLLLDIDHFKEFNDRYGHQVGDDCLRTVAAAVRATVRAMDTVARYGGDEITIILPGADTSAAVEAAEKGRSAIEALRITHEGNPEGGGWITASVGAATALAREGGTMRMPESLLLAADNALYKAKHGGRNCVATALLVASKNSLEGV